MKASVLASFFMGIWKLLSNVCVHKKSNNCIKRLFENVLVSVSVALYDMINWKISCKTS